MRRALGTLFSAGRNVAKYIDLPLANYATLPFDKIVKGGKTIGLSTYTGYSFNERSMLSLAVIDEKHAKPGTKVTLVWGEEGRRHDEADRRATQADQDPRDGRARAVRRHGAHRVSAEVTQAMFPAGIAVFAWRPARRRMARCSQ